MTRIGVGLVIMVIAMVIAMVGNIGVNLGLSSTTVEAQRKGGRNQKR